MNKPDFVPYIMSFITENDYPLVHSKNPEEMAEVFHISNRNFLVSWALTLLDENCYKSILKGREQDKCLLAEMVYCHGFCTDGEKLGFLNGDLPVDEQIQILCNMFKFIERQKKAVALREVETVTLDDLYALRSKDLNLFPSFGEIKYLSEEERQSKINEIYVRMEKLKLEQAQIKEQSNSQKVTKIKKEHIKNIVNDINESLDQFERVIKSIGRETYTKVDPNYKTDPTFVELLQKCNEYVKIITQFTEDLKTINEFNIDDIQMPVDEVTPLVEMLTEQMQSMGLD